jgi:hypothetical protein
MKGQNRYILTERSKSLNAPVWVLRKNPYIETEEGLKQIRYVRGSKTIFADDIDEKLPSTTIEFHDGTLNVPKADKLLNEYLQAHPEFNKNFKLFDPDAEALAELQMEDEIDEAIVILNSMKQSEREAVSVSIWGDLGTRDSNDEILRLKLKKYIKEKTKDGKLKEDFTGKTQAKHFVELAQDPTNEVRFLAIQAKRAGIIEISPNKTAVTWANGGVIVPVASGQSPISKFVDHLNSSEGELTLQELSKKLGGNKKGKK